VLCWKNIEEGACGLFCVTSVSMGCAEKRCQRGGEAEDEYAHVSYYFFSGLFGLVVGAAGDLVLLEAGIALTDDSLDLGELARLLLYSHGDVMLLCCVYVM
jgi:hypothetical protein